MGNIDQDLISKLKEMLDRQRESEARAARDARKPGIYPVHPVPRTGSCSCRRMGAMSVPAGHYFQCECGNRIYGPMYVLERRLSPFQVTSTDACCW